MPKTFTVDEANQTLVLVKPILEDIRRYAYEILTLKGEKDPNEKIIAEKLEKLRSCFQELAQIQCECKNIERGLVDFPSYYKDELVLLCWQLGEKTIEYWHRSHGGYDHRQKIDEEFLKWNYKTALTESPLIQ